MFNFYIGNNAFPNGLKKADINPVYKEVNPFDKTYYRHISILPQVYKYKDTNISYNFKQKYICRKPVENQICFVTRYL